MIFEEPADFASALPPAGAILGLDLGTKTIGLAASDVRRTIATPFRTLKRRAFGKDAAALEAEIAGRAAVALVLGLPRNMNGSEGPRAQSTRAFARNFVQRMPLPVLLWDERLTSVAAERALVDADASRRRRSEVIDQVAAGLILQGALDRLAYLAMAQ